MVSNSIEMKKAAKLGTWLLRKVALVLLVLGSEFYPLAYLEVWLCSS